MCVLLYVFCCGSFFNSGWLVSKSNCLDLNMATILAYARVNKCEIKYMQKYPDLILFRNQICGKSRNTSKAKLMLGALLQFQFSDMKQTTLVLSLFPGVTFPGITHLIN